MASCHVSWGHRLYSAALDAASPALTLFVWQRALLGFDRWDRVQERFGYPTAVERRPSGPVFWFHGASIGECAMAVALVEKCLQQRPYATVLFTTQDTVALSFIERSFPKGLVICQYAPLDTARAVEAFLGFWRPYCAVLMESELWPNMLLGLQRHRVRVGVLNARMSPGSFLRWSSPGACQLAEAMLQHVALLTTPHSVQALQFQLLGVNPMAVHFSGDLKFATQRVLERPEAEQLERLRGQVGRRPVWVAASTHAGEEEVVARVHVALLEQLPGLLTILVPRHPARRHSVLKMLESRDLAVAVRSRRDKLQASTQVYLADTTGEMQVWYNLASLAFVGGSMLRGVGGHNLSEAALASCAVLVGPHTANFQGMVDDMQKTAPLSVWQVSNEAELTKAVRELLSNEAKRNARSIAAKRAAAAASDGVVSSVWCHVDSTLLRGSEPGADVEAPLRADGPNAELSPILHKQFLRVESGRGPSMGKQFVREESGKGASMRSDGPNAELSPIMNKQFLRVESERIRPTNSDPGVDDAKKKLSAQFSMKL